MKAFKFNIKISANGTIKIPYIPVLFNRDVEIIIVPKERRKKSKNAGKKFIDKWAGSLSGEDTDSSRYDYLSEKYK